MTSSGDNFLEEVVVTAYGIKRAKKSLTYQTQKIRNGLAGKVAGLQINLLDNGINPTSQVLLRGLRSVQKEGPLPLIIINGSIYHGNLDKIEPNWITDMTVLKGEDATALYGADARNGVLILNIDKSILKKEFPSLVAKESFEIDKTSSIRNNFSDVGFWQPKLTTDKQGKVSFQLTFPDNITSWDTHYIAMDSHKKTGVVSGRIRSFKELMAQLSVPRFLIKGDTVKNIGKIQNLSKDSVSVTSSFEINGEIKEEKVRFCKNILVDTLSIYAEKDTMSLSYYIKNSQGISDGEIRKIPVFQKGISKTIGAFIAMEKDTSITIEFDKQLGEVYLYAKADLLEVLEEEIKHVANYRFDCNEQLASKLKALLAEERIAKHKETLFKNRRKVEKIIKLLMKNRLSSGFWGWWKKSNENDNISLHVVEALLQADELNYKVGLNKHYLSESLILRFEKTDQDNSKIQILRILKKMDVVFDYEAAITELNKSNSKSFNQQLQLLSLKQLCSIPHNTIHLDNFKQKTLFGNFYYSDNKSTNSLWNNDIQNTLIVYDILKNEPKVDTEKLQKIRQYLLEKRNTNWKNTYESAKIIEAILPDILLKNSSKDKPKFSFKGAINKTIIDFPFAHKLENKKPLTIEKSGDTPVYFTYYQKFWEKNPEVIEGNFKVTSHFENDIEFLEGGKPTNLITKLDVKKDTEFVMLSIPIPAGCTYQSKEGSIQNETHREYFKNETVVFFEYLPKGTYNVMLNLLPKYSGVFTLNPVKVELMYFPTFNANNQLKTVKIK